MASHNELGAQGEAIAARFLIKKGYKILATNYRFKHLELDIVCEFDNHLVIVEVKTRSFDAVQRPEMAVTKSKQKQLIKAAHQFIIENEIDLETRFDVIGMILQGNRSDINHIENAFMPGL
jgi:putative endonuclease